MVTHILMIEKQRVSDALGPQAPRRASLKSSLMALVISTVLGRAQPWGGGGGCHHGEFLPHANLSQQGHLGLATRPPLV